MSAYTVNRPLVTQREVPHIATTLFGLNVVTTKQLPSFEDRNFLITCDDMVDGEHTFILKAISNQSCSQEGLSLQHAVMRTLKKRGFICTQVLRNRHHEEISHFDLPDATKTSEDEEKSSCIVRLMTYIPGTNLFDHMSDVTEQTLHEIGELLGELHKTLKTVTSSPLDADDTENFWRIENVMKLETLLKPDSSFSYNDCRKQLLLEIIHSVEENALRELPSSFAKGFIHGDIQDMNIIVNFKDGKFQPLFPNNSNNTSLLSKYGIIDFGDLSYSSYVFELAMVIADFMLDCNNIAFWDIGGHILAGYLKSEKLTEAEFNVIYYVIAARYCQYIILGEHAYQAQPDNDYSRLGSDESWEKIQILWKSNILDVYATWNNILREQYNINRHELEKKKHSE